MTNLLVPLSSVFICDHIFSGFATVIEMLFKLAFFYIQDLREILAISLIKLLMFSTSLVE